MLKLPQHIINALKTNSTSLGDHPAFPPRGGDDFIFNIVLNSFKNICGDTNLSLEQIKELLDKCLTRAKSLERKHISKLEELCGEVVSDFFNIPEDSVIIDMDIVDNISFDDERMEPEKTEGFSFEDIAEMQSLTEEVYKRRMLNALIAGAALYYAQNMSPYLDKLFEINEDLPSLYKKILKYNNILTFFEEENIDPKENTDAGRVDVVVSSSQELPKIKAVGLIFPILVEETIKGILELAISHGLPEATEQASYIIGKSDFKVAELWDIRIGYALWMIILNQVEKSGYDLKEVGLNFFFMELSELSCEDFNSVLKEVFAGTKAGKQALEDICGKIENEKEKDAFNGFISSKKSDNEGHFFSPDELFINDAYIY